MGRRMVNSPIRDGDTSPHPRAEAARPSGRRSDRGADIGAAPARRGFAGQANRTMLGVASGLRERTRRWSAAEAKVGNTTRSASKRAIARQRGGTVVLDRLGFRCGGTVKTV
jgi:hypothetical protein